MTFSICIGAYKLADFVELNICRCRVIFGDDVPICIDDDKSESSGKIEAIAEKYDCYYVCSEKRRGHFAGDCQTIVNSLVFGNQIQSDISLKISQRVIPVLPRFREIFEEAFANPQIQIVVPGQIKQNQIARPAAMFFSKFGILTDVIGFRTGALDPTAFVDVYRERFQRGKNHADSLIETTIGYLIASRFKDAAVISDELANHKPFQPKIYLRKSQALEREYQQIADMHGIAGQWDLRDWGLVERADYFCRPVCV